MTEQQRAKAVETQEQEERKRLLTYFQLYFKYSGCDNLTISNIGTFERSDFTMTSASTTSVKEIIGEVKIRSGSAGQFAEKSALIEYPKWQYLHSCSTAKVPFYLSDFDDFIIIHNLKRFFDTETYCDLDAHFGLQLMRENNYSSRKVWKSVRYLHYAHADLIIDKTNFETISYNQLLERLTANYNEQNKTVASC